ncbi:MAG: glycosyltransferase family 2 protein [Patescibacteria group bacterium]
MVKQISLIIVTWNVRDHLLANLEEIFRLACPLSFEVIVVDNGSSDGSAKMVRDRFPLVKLIQNDWDSGFAYACNQGLRVSMGEISLLLNPDMLLEAGTLEKTYELLTTDKTIGVMGVKLTTKDNQPINSVRRLPDLGSQLAIVFKLPRIFPKLIGRYLFEDFDYNRCQDVDQVRGSYFAFRRELLQTIGYLDEAYHIWFEEVDYCRRVKQAGLRVHYCAEVSCHDYVGRSFSKMKHLEKQRIFTASMYHYFKKWQPGWQAFVIAVCRPVGITLAYLADRYEAVTGKTV